MIRYHHVLWLVLSKQLQPVPLPLLPHTHISSISAPVILLTRLTPLRDPFQYTQSPPFRCGGKPNISNLKRASFISFIHFERLSVSSFSFPIHLLLSSQYCTARRSIHTAAPKLPHVHLERGRHFYHCSGDPFHIPVYYAKNMISARLSLSDFSFLKPPALPPSSIRYHALATANPGS